MLLLVTLDRNRGGAGPTLFSYDKATDQVTKVGPLFDASSPFSWSTGEGWYWSATRPSALYLNDGPRMRRYDVASRQLETVFDAATEFGPDRALWQMHSSDDDRVHSATLKSSVTWEALGCLVYREDTREFSFFERTGEFDECQIDRSGRWLVIKENVDGVNGEDNRIIDVERGGERLFLDQEGAAGHSDAGMGYMVAEDNWHPLPGAVRLWRFGQALPGSPPQGRVVYHTTDWASSIGHISHTNARAGVPPAQQYACGGGASRTNAPRANEIVCFRLDASLDVLVVAPVMTDLGARGGRTDYAKRPKGNLDVTGQYFIWTGNAGTNRLDAFVVRVPAHRLTGTAPPPGPGGPGTFTDAFDRSDSSALGDDWREVQGDLKIKRSRLSSKGTGRAMAVVPDLVGPVQTVAVDFTSMDNSVDPEFGVVLRYQDPENYYLVYRRAGGTSALRVAKVVDGVETVLQETPLRNPRAKKPFRIEVRADGATLAVTLNGAPRISVVDATFQSGSPGVMLADGAPGGTPPRADSFSATIE
jgi:hypothetical protein